MVHMVPEGISRIPNATSIQHQQPEEKPRKTEQNSQPRRTMKRDVTTRESQDQTETTAKMPGAEGHRELIRKLGVCWGLRGRRVLQISAQFSSKPP